MRRKKMILMTAVGLLAGSLACLPRNQAIFFSPRLAADPGPVIEEGQTAKLTVVGQNLPDDLRYQWLVDAGGGTCNPQRTSDGATVYQAPSSIGELSEKPVRVTVEFYLDGAKQGEEPILLTIKKPQPQATQSETPQPVVGARPKTGPTIEITQSGVFDPRGERLAEDTIKGKVSGVTPAEYQIILYTLAGGQWFIQPYALGPGRFTEIETNGSFSNTYHVGVKYAALVVKRGWEDPPIQTLVLPLNNENVVAFSTADGIKPTQ